MSRLGYSSDEVGLVAQVQRHAREAHGMALTHDEALLLACGAVESRSLASDPPFAMGTFGEPRE
jgi:hypothetical protein